AQFQAIRAVHQVGDEGLSADLTTRPMERFLGERPSHAMILDPVMLDGALQVMGVWAYERLPEPGMMFPLQVDEVLFYGPRCHYPTVLRCHLQVSRCDYRQALGSMDLIGSTGQVRVRIVGARQYRIHCPAHRIRSSRDPRTGLTGELWTLPTAPLPSQGNYVASLVDG